MLRVVFSSQRLILCEASLLDMFLATVATKATVVPYSGEIIGGDGDGRDMPLRDYGLPIGLEMIIAKPGCDTARQLTETIRLTGFPRMVPVVEAPQGGWWDRRSMGARLLSAYVAAGELLLEANQKYAESRDREIVALRRRVEWQTLTNNQLSDFLQMLGYSSRELALAETPDIGRDFIVPPLERPLPMLLSDISGVSIFLSPSERTRRARISIIVGDTVAHFQDVEFPEKEGWNDIFFPQGFLEINQDATLLIEPIEGELSIAEADHSAAADFDARSRRIALRLWRHASSQAHEIRSEAGLYLPRPTSVKGSVLTQDSVADSAETFDVVSTVSLIDDGFIQTHPAERGISNFVIRDFEIGSIRSIDTVVSLAHPNADPVRFLMVLAPRNDDSSELYKGLAAAVCGSIPPDWRIDETTLPARGSQVLTINTSGLSASVRYNLILAAVPAGNGARYGWARWRYVRFSLCENDHVQTYRFSNLASLYSHLNFADGPFAESSLNTKLGFAVLSVADGERYLQTHPVPNYVVGARLDDFLPRGTQRFWVEVSNEHEQATSTEFGVIFSRDTIRDGFSQHYFSKGYDRLSDGVLHHPEEGVYLKKIILDPRTDGLIDVFLTETLHDNYNLYLYVRAIGEKAQYGWCRWHRLAMTILAPQNLT